MKNNLLLLVSFFLLQQLSAQYTTDFEISTPEAEGISSSAILDFISQAEEKIDAVHSFMLIRHGKVISKGWWAPYGPESPHVMHSLSKSFTSTAIGMAADEGKLSLNDKVISFFPEYVPEKPSWQWQSLRIRDLITMNTGHIEEPNLRNDTSGDWVKFFMESELDLKPGTHFKYNSAATYMLSAILQKVTGEKLVDYLEPRLFQPLNIKKPHWDSCPKGINTGGWGLRITTEDIAKLGQLYLQQGQWQGKQLISKEWVTMATSKQTSNGSNPDNDWEQGYGFQFWQCRYGNYRGDGAMGQFCIVFPEHDAVLAVTSGTFRMDLVMQVAWETLLPAFQANALPPNADAVANLEATTKSLALQSIPGELTSDISKKLAKKTFQIDENVIGIKTISFDLHKKEHSIRFGMEEGEEILAIGKDSYQKGMIQQNLPYTTNLLKKIAASGAWIAPDVYQLRVYFYEMPERITYTFKFEEDELIWDSKLEHSLFGPRKQEQLRGR